jgi:hypothetical protein
MIAYIPDIRCAKCNKPVLDVMRLQDGNRRYLRVRCHGKEERIGFAASPKEVVTLWQEPDAPREATPS